MVKIEALEGMFACERTGSAFLDAAEGASACVMRGCEDTHLMMAGDSWMFVKGAMEDLA